MPTVVQPAFTRGELSPKVQSRIDIDQYGQGLSVCSNFAILIQGPMRKRPGTGFIAPIKDHSSKAHLIPFVFSTKQAYVLEFGNFYIRFFALRGQVKVSGNPYEITSPYAIDDVANLKYLEINDIIYIVHNKYPTYKLSRLGETNWTIVAVDFIDGPYLDTNLTSTSLLTSNTGRPAGSGTPIQAWDLDVTTDMSANANVLPVSLTYTFSGSAVIADGYSLVYAGYPNNGAFEESNSRAPRSWVWEGLIPGTSTWVELDSRNNESSWIPGETRRYDYTNKLTAYSAYRLTVLKLNGGNSWGLRFTELYIKVRDFPMTLTFSATTGINRGVGFTNDDIGRYIRFKTKDGFWKNLKITSVTSTTIVNGLYNGLWNNAVTRTTVWQLGAFSKPSGYPGAISDFEGRLVLGGTLESPRNVYLSSSTDLEDFSPKDPLVDSAPINIRLSGNQQNAILWLTPGKALFVGTTEGVTAITAGNNEPLTYKNIKQVMQTNFGANSITPVRIGPAVLYVSYFANCIRELLYTFSDDTYDAPDISLLSEHLLSSTITDIQWARSPASELYITTVEGTLVCMSYDRLQKVNGLTPFPTDGKVEGVAIIPGIDGKRDDIYIQVNRTINGVTKRYIEYFASPFEGNDLNSAWFVDSGLEYSGAYTNVLSGLGHLEGKQVAAFVRGIADNNGNLGAVPAIFGATVQAGQITLPSGVTTNNALVGLPFTALATVLQTRAPDRFGETMYTKKSRADRIVLDILNSAGIEVQGKDGETWEDVLERVPNNLMDQLIPLFTGLKDIPIDGSWDDKGVFSIRSIYPLPATIRTITAKLDREII